MSRPTCPACGITIVPSDDEWGATILCVCETYITLPEKPPSLATRTRGLSLVLPGAGMMVLALLSGALAGVLSLKYGFMSPIDHDEGIILEFLTYGGGILGLAGIVLVGIGFAVSIRTSKVRSPKPESFSS